eukprot:1511095-Amphidinium_carterae.1
MGALRGGSGGPGASRTAMGAKGGTGGAVFCKPGISLGLCVPDSVSRESNTRNKARCFLESRRPHRSSKPSGSCT